MKKVITIAIVMLIVLLVVFPYLRAEYYTNKYGEYFSEGYKETGWFESIEYYKVVDVSDTKATVVYISGGHSACFRCYFEKINNKWTYSSWDCVWTKLGGSADGFMWPYYW